MGVKAELHKPGMPVNKCGRSGKCKLSKDSLPKPSSSKKDTAENPGCGKILDAQVKKLSAPQRKARPVKELMGLFIEQLEHSWCDNIWIWHLGFTMEEINLLRKEVLKRCLK